MGNPPVILSIAGSDNSCGAGAQADLKTITALGGFGQTAITCVVAEAPGRVSAIQSVPPRIIAEQIRLSRKTFPIAAIKTGMLHSASIIRTVAAELDLCKKLPPLVVDPVMVASSGNALLKKTAIAAYETLLFPKATLVTPNLDELRVLSKMPCRNLGEIKKAGATLVERYGCAFLLKGGHLLGKYTAVDILATFQGFKSFSAPFLKDVDVHGTGCTLSSAIAVGLAFGLPLDKAVAKAKKFITETIRHRYHWGALVALNHAAKSMRRLGC